MRRDGRVSLLWREDYLVCRRQPARRIRKVGRRPWAAASSLHHRAV